MHTSSWGFSCILCTQAHGVFLAFLCTQAHGVFPAFLCTQADGVFLAFYRHTLAFALLSGSPLLSFTACSLPCPCSCQRTVILTLRCPRLRLFFCFTLCSLLCVLLPMHSFSWALCSWKALWRGRCAPWIASSRACSSRTTAGLHSSCATRCVG